MSDSGVVNVNLNGALLASGIKTNLISVSRLLRQGLTVTFYNDSVEVINTQGSALVRGIKQDGLFKLAQHPAANYTSSAPIFAFAALSVSYLTFWHHRFGHLNHHALKWLASSGLVAGLDIEASSQIYTCDACAAGKANRLPFSRSVSRATACLDLVHTDLLEVNSPFFGGARYILTFLDDHLRFLWIFFLKHKSDTLSHFHQQHALVERQLEHKLKSLRSDNGGEYLSNEFQSYLRSKSIRSQFTVAHTPQQNDVAERINRSMQDGARTLLAQSGLSKSL